MEETSKQIAQTILTLLEFTIPYESLYPVT